MRARCCEFITQYGKVLGVTEGTTPASEKNWFDARRCPQRMGGIHDVHCPYACKERGVFKPTSPFQVSMVSPFPTAPFASACSAWHVHGSQPCRTAAHQQRPLCVPWAGVRLQPRLAQTYLTCVIFRSARRALGFLQRASRISGKDFAETETETQ